ncbi:hypothetical protein [Halomonas lysinitropha]|uniref:Uncharacterized protein n=1 Tax=Halomonas lysinitropha TaxID=2607506 RepID=A0A5K1HYM3_9GAMM|nr:hypothetical protein [Halomonas lysinitropha]VVZ94644.1 hypothetical protein HALO32_00699 [Halomonas lysinitropha]
MAMSTKLYRLKEWLTIEDAASHLSALLSEQVAPKDVLQLALERHLKLSVLFLAPTYARRGQLDSLMRTEVKLVPPDVKSDSTSTLDERLEEKAWKVLGWTLDEIMSFDSELKEAIETGSLRVIPLRSEIYSDRYVGWHNDFFEIEGVWDLPLMAGERADVKKLYQEMIGGYTLELFQPEEAAWVERDSVICTLYEDPTAKINEPKHAICEVSSGYFMLDHYAKGADNLIESKCLPKESKIVVRRQNLDRFIESLEELGPTKDFEGEEKRLLEVFGMLVELYASEHGHGYWHGGRPNMSRIVQDMLDSMPDDVTNMGNRKLQDVVSHALKAWEAKKRR